MERYKILRIVLRRDQANRLYDYGFQLKLLRTRGKEECDQSQLFELTFPKTTVVTQEPEERVNGAPGIAHVQPLDGEGYLREFRWRPAVEEVSARMCSFVMLKTYIHRIDPPKKPKEEKTDDEPKHDPDGRRDRRGLSRPKATKTTSRMGRPLSADQGDCNIRRGPRSSYHRRDVQP